MASDSAGLLQVLAYVKARGLGALHKRPDFTECNSLETLGLLDISDGGGLLGSLISMYKPFGGNHKLEVGVTEFTMWSKFGSYTDYYLVLSNLNCLLIHHETSISNRP